MGFGETLKNWFTDWAEYIAKPWEYAIGWGFERAIKTVIPNSYVYFKELVSLMEGAAQSPSLKEMVESGQLHELFQNAIKSQDHHSAPTYKIAEVEALSAIGAILGAPLGFFPFVGDVYSAGWSQEIRQDAAWVERPTLLEAQHAISLNFRGKMTDDELETELGRMGFSSARVLKFRDALRPLLSPDLVRQYSLREESGALDPDGELAGAGFTAAQVEAIKKLWWIIPGPQDLIRMAVREAFSPEIVSKYNTDADFPAEFAAWAKKQGLSEFWAKNYWRAHWDLPSASQGFEMLHRGIIDESELDTLLRTLDVMPYWRDRLTQIAYNPFTRVDVRRMHALGILTRDQVKQAYMDIGFNDQKAEAMTQFTIEYNAGADKDLNKTDILALYKKGVLTETETKERLIDLDYSEEDADYLIARETTLAVAEAHDLSLTQIKQLALAGIIEKAEAAKRLADLGYTAEDIVSLYSLWELEAQPQDARPSRTDLARFYQKGIITLDQWIDGMYNLRYSEEAIGWYYLDMTGS